MQQKAETDQNLVTLRSIRPEEFPDYQRYFIQDYSEEMVENYGYSQEAAVIKAEKDLQQSFPEGIGENEQNLLSIDAEIDGISTLVGYLWHTINKEERTSFICDFYVFERFRGGGFGKKAMVALEQRLGEAEITELKLRVAYSNRRALKLYEDIGFRVTGINLSKLLD